MAGGPGPGCSGGADGSGQGVELARAGPGPVRFAAAKAVDAERRFGEMSMLAVEPAAQGEDIGAALSEVATEWMRTEAMLDTGGDPGHAPARRAYKKIGYSLFPIARYFKAP